MPSASTAAERITFGERIYTANCVACHQANGEGIALAFPPLAASDYLNADQARAISAVVNGLEGAITVNGATFNGVMPALRLTDDDVANVLTYVYSEWGNSGAVVLPEEVEAVRR
jgi:nitrite reductase (NO-forming)